MGGVGKGVNEEAGDLGSYRGGLSLIVINNHAAFANPPLTACCQIWS